jgi:hypothetical protein
MPEFSDTLLDLAARASVLFSGQGAFVEQHSFAIQAAPITRRIRKVQ